MRFDFFLAVTTILVLVFVPVWFISPLALGFDNRSTVMWQHQLADSLFALSYAVGLPAMVIGQIISFVLHRKGHETSAFVVPSATILFFLVTACGTLVFF